MDEREKDEETEKQGINKAGVFFHPQKYTEAVVKSKEKKQKT